MPRLKQFKIIIARFFKGTKLYTTRILMHHFRNVTLLPVIVLV